MPKRFAIPADKIKPLAPNRGSCIATDRITVDARPVGYMYREPPDNKLDSGWRFFAGDESDEYANTPGNIDLYDLNTIANYAPEIIPLLDTPAPCAFIRDSSGRLVRDE